VLKGRWRFFWGRHGTTGETLLEEGDLFDIPTGMFRGFENVGDDYGMIMAVLGGDDAGGGVVWAPEVIADAAAHGLILAETGMLYDTKRGQKLPDGVSPMPPLDEAALAQLADPGVEDVVPHYVARYQEMLKQSAKEPVRVLGDNALINDRPGFEIDLISRDSLGTDAYVVDSHEVLMPFRGHWRIEWDDGAAVLNPGDTCAVPPGMSRTLYPSMSGESALYRVRGTEDAAGPTHTRAA